MNKREKELQQAFLNNEKAVLKSLEETYKDALDEINSKIEALMSRQDADMQHVIYQVQYQQSLKKQVEAILETMHSNEFETISDFLTTSYEDGYIGALYNIQGQGIPLALPIDPAQVTQAIQADTNLNETLYKALGKDITVLKKQIASEISRGLATGAMYSEIARNVAGYSRIPLNNAMRITRTEAHRIQTKAGMDACEKAKARGADVIKQWDASLDKRTRDSHVRLDGERRELNKPFSNGLMYPGDPSGPASEVINCRCSILQRAKWALDADETKHLGDLSGMSDKQLEPLAKKLHMTPDELRLHQNEIVPINASSYSDFKQKYNQLWKYEGSEVQARAEKRIAGYEKKQNTKGGAKRKGLGANDEFIGVLPHKAPEIISHVDFDDDEAVLSLVRKFEKDAIHESIETACIVTRDGTVYKCYGVEDRCFVDSDLGDLLNGSKGTHNHPIAHTRYSFSGDDRELFSNYQMAWLRGVDEKYTYEFRRNSEDVDEHLSIFDIDPTLDGEHENCITKAEQFGFGYHRWKND